jgi:hypothetical protein
LMAAPTSPLVLAGAPTAMTVEDRVWAEKAGELELDALKTIRGLAEKWAASLTGALGVVGLAALLEGSDKFNKLDRPWKAIAQIGFTAAIVLALIATALSIAAAQGAAKRVFVPGGTALRDYSRTAVNDALRSLKYSRILAVVASAGVLIAGYCLWFGDRAKGSASVIELPAGSQPCPPGVGTVDVAKSDADIVVRCGK